jgi:hypothetical protein
VRIRFRPVETWSDEQLATGPRLLRHDAARTPSLVLADTLDRLADAAEMERLYREVGPDLPN